MDPVFDAYFRERLDAIWMFRDPDGIAAQGGDRLSQQAHVMVRNGLERARQIAADQGAALRGDAETLLYVAFTEVVARPAIAVRGDSPDLHADIEADIALVTQRAALGAPGAPISAHAVVDSVSRSWDELRTTRWLLRDERSP
jgi:hypothetical protein